MTRRRSTSPEEYQKVGDRLKRLRRSDGRALKALASLLNTAFAADALRRRLAGMEADAARGIEARLNPGTDSEYLACVYPDVPTALLAFADCNTELVDILAPMLGVTVEDVWAVAEPPLAL